MRLAKLLRTAYIPFFVLPLMHCGSWTTGEQSNGWTLATTISNKDGILNGTYNEQLFPYVGALLRLEQKSGEQEVQVVSLCTGTLINNGVVLTAAHCLTKSEEQSTKTAWVFTLDPNLVDSGPINNWWAVKTIQIHPNYSLNFCNPARSNEEQAACDNFQRNCQVKSDSTEDQIKDCFANLTPEEQERANYIPLRPVYDLALVFLTTANSPNKELPVVQASLPTSNMGIAFNTTTPVFIAGYGKQFPSNDTSLSRKPDNVDAKFYGQTSIYAYNSENLQLGVKPNEAKTCFGDSGGPAILQSGGTNKPGDNDDILIGVTSRARNILADCEDGAVFSRIDTEQEWINQAIIAGQSVNAEPPASNKPKTGCQQFGTSSLLLLLEAYALFAYLSRRKQLAN